MITDRISQPAVSRRGVYAVPYSYEFPLPFTQAGETITVTMKIISEQDFELYQIVADNSDQFFFNIVDGSTNSSLFDNPGSSLALTGTAQRPFTLPVSYIFARNRSITITATNGTTDDNPGTISLKGATLFDAPAAQGTTVRSNPRADWTRRDMEGSFFVYVKEINSIAGVPNSIQDSVTIFSNSDFELFYLNSSHDETVNFNLQLVDGSSGLRMFDNPTPLRNTAGIGQRPYVFPVSRVFRASGNININAIDAIGIPFAGKLHFIGANIRRIQ